MLERAPIVLTESPPPHIDQTSFLYRDQGDIILSSHSSEAFSEAVESHKAFWRTDKEAKTYA